VSPDARQELGQAQAALLRALVDGGVLPEGFDRGRIQAAADALVRKRTRLVAKVWPALAEALGPGFGPRFAAYARHRPLPEAGGALVDGLLFVGDGLRKTEFTDALRLERLWAEAQLVWSRGQVRPRRCPAVKFSWLPQNHRLAVLLTVPGRRARLLLLPLPA
jgi:hypothetical protein